MVFAYDDNLEFLPLLKSLCQTKYLQSIIDKIAVSHTIFKFLANLVNNFENS